MTDYPMPQIRIHRTASAGDVYKITIPGYSRGLLLNDAQLAHLAAVATKLTKDNK